MCICFMMRVVCNCCKQNKGQSKIFFFFFVLFFRFVSCVKASLIDARHAQRLTCESSSNHVHMGDQGVMVTINDRGQS